MAQAGAADTSGGARLEFWDTGKRVPVLAVRAFPPELSKLSSLDVDSVRDCFEVVRVDTASGPTLVVDFAVVRNRSDEVLEGKSVGPTNSSVEEELTVVSWTSRSNPEPATGVRFRDELVEESSED